jgi:hypothetical protein
MEPAAQQAAEPGLAPPQHAFPFRQLAGQTLRGLFIVFEKVVQR